MSEKRYITSTRIDKHGTVMTLNALEDMVEQINSDRKVIIGVAHDRTFPPLGYITSAEIVTASDGHHEVYANYEYFQEPTEILLPDGYMALIQHNQFNKHPLSIANIENPEELIISVDVLNFDNYQKADFFYEELREELGINFKRSCNIRKSLISDPEIIFNLTLKLVPAWILLRTGNSIASAFSEVVKEESRDLFKAIIHTIKKYASYAVPTDRPITYALKEPGKPNIEYVARSNDPDKVIKAFSNLSNSDLEKNIASLKVKFNPELIQFMLSDEGEWKFNYLVTYDGTTIGTKESFDNRTKMLNKIETNNSAK